MISVVVPIYNVQEYLSQCLDSLYSQRCVDLEVILVNDGSTDSSLKICQEYAQRYTNTNLIIKENGGLSDARNVGTKTAKGEYIYYLDSDDWLAPDAIKSLYDFAIENDCEIVQGGFYYAYNDHLLYSNTRNDSRVISRNEAIHELIKNDYIKNFAWGKLYRADLVKKHLFTKGKFYEDTYWQHLIVNECGRYGIIPTPLYFYRQRHSGISGMFSIRNLDLLCGYEERLSFVQEKYPEYTRDMVKMLWHLGLSNVKMARKSKDIEIEKAFCLYWKELNQKYIRLFEEFLSADVEYRISRHFSSLLPLIDIYKRVVARLAPPVKYKVVKRDNV